MPGMEERPNPYQSPVETEPIRGPWRSMMLVMAIAGLVMAAATGGVYVVAGCGIIAVLVSAFWPSGDSGNTDMIE